MTDADTLAGYSIFDRLSAAQRAALVAGVARPVEFSDGARLFEEGDEANGCWLIRSGRIAVETAVPGRGPVVVQSLGPGDVLGLSWLVPPHRWHFAATAVGAVSAQQLDTGQLAVLIGEDSAIGYPLVLGMFEVLLARLQNTRARLLDLYGSPRER